MTPIVQLVTTFEVGGRVEVVRGGIESATLPAAAAGRLASEREARR